MKGIINIHVPHSSDTRIGAALRFRYLHNNATIDTEISGKSVQVLFPHTQGEARISAEYCQRGDELACLMTQQVQCISGQVRYNAELHKRSKEYSFVTMLRDPVDRFMAHYRDLKRHYPDRHRPDTLEKFLETPEAARLASQYLFHFAGHSQNQTSNLTRSVLKAQYSLAQFDLIGDFSNPAEFARGLRRLTGGYLHWSRNNRAPHISVLPYSLRSKVAALCAPDLAIYQTARMKIVA